MFLNLKIYFWFSGHPASSAPLDTQEAEISTPPPDRPAPHSPTGSGRSVELGGAPGLPAPGSYPHPSQGDWTFLISAFFVQKLNLTFFLTFKRKFKKVHIYNELGCSFHKFGQAVVFLLNYGLIPKLNKNISNMMKDSMVDWLINLLILQVYGMYLVLSSMAEHYTIYKLPKWVRIYSFNSFLFNIIQGRIILRLNPPRPQRGGGDFW